MAGPLRSSNHVTDRLACNRDMLFLTPERHELEVPLCCIGGDVMPPPSYIFNLKAALSINQYGARIRAS
jgi:hypothetical protein